MASNQEDWSTIWRSEMNALAGDREPMEALAAGAALWAAWWQSTAALTPPLHERAARPEPSPRPAPALAASDDGADDRARLAGRVAELERRLAELERTRPDQD